MKKTILLFAAVVAAAIQLSAQTNSKEIIGNFTEIRTPAQQGKAVTVTGRLHFKAPEYLSMLYDNGDKFLIDGNKMVIINEEAGNQVFDTSKNLMMRSLSHAVIYAFTGRAGDIASEQNADISEKKDGKETVITLQARKKAVKGYEKIEIRYAADGNIRAMKMTEFTGAVTEVKL